MTAPPPLVRAFPRRPPVCHLETRCATNGAFLGPACGQRSLDGSSWARTTYTKLAERVTCKKCAKAAAKLATNL